MAAKPKHENKLEGLAASLPKDKADARDEPRRKSFARPRPRGNAGGKVEAAQPVPPIVRLIQSLGQEKIRFQLVGMSAAILQGVLVTTLDTDIWVDLPERQYVRLMNLVLEQDGTALAPTLYALSDGHLVNFLFTVHGLRSFDVEFKHSVKGKIEGESVRVLPLERILKSKKTIRRDKDLVHIFHIERFLKCRKKLKGKK